MAKKSRDIKYLNKDFSQFRENLIQMAKTYYKDTINDFSPNDPAMMFVEMSSYVGDVLSFYIDKQLRESFLLYAQEKKNIFALAQSLGYRPLPKTPSVVTLEIFQLIPAKGTGASITPDWDYALKVKKGMQATSNESSITFRTTEDVDFNVALDRTISVYQIDNAGNPLYYLVKKSVTAISGEISQTTITIGEPEQYKKIVLSDKEITSIESVVDSNGNNWVEVPFLAQSTILKSEKNTNNININNSLSDYEKSPYILSWVEVPKRFVTRYRNDYSLELQFGGGLTDNNEAKEYIPNPYNIGLTTPFGRTHMGDYFAQSNVISQDSYGEVPQNTTMTINYIRGGGIKTNVRSNTITKINLIETETYSTNLNQELLNATRNSIAVNNPEPARGGRDEMSEEEIRQNSLMSFASQYRAITQEDYTVRTLSMPSKFGSVAKAYVKRSTNDTTKNANINIHVLSYDSDKKLTQCSTTLKNNIVKYLQGFKMITDNINIIDAFIVNIKVDFEITVLPEYNSNEVLLNCIDKLKDYFNIDKWSINQPIIESDIIKIIANTDGVQSVIEVLLTDNSSNISSIHGTYNLDAAYDKTKKVWYPSLDPMIFEVRNQDTDIRGKVHSY